MGALVWDQISEHDYETGTDHAVVYPYNSETKKYDSGAAWSGITGVTESPSGAEETALYADNIKYLSLRSAEEYAQTVTAYTYPKEFAKLDGSDFPTKGMRIYQQTRKTFGMSYRTILGNDTEGNDHGYKLHLIYGLTASPSERTYSTVNDSPEANEFSWEMQGVPVPITGYKNTCLVTIDSVDFVTETEREHLQDLLDVLYGKDGVITYDVVSDPEVGSNPSELGWYERTGTEGHYVYTLSEDTTVDAQKTYCVKTETGGQEPRLPLPDEVKQILEGVAG